MKSFFEQISQYSVVTLIGMCKNAGKTSALGCILRSYDQTGQLLALTSIGRDGERVDLVTGTEKPGIYVRRGTLIATAAGLLPASDITREIVAATGIQTPLGEVVVVRALSDGHIELAGPSMVNQLVALRQLLESLGAQRVLIDGAISRKTLCSRKVSEATVLSVGASCGWDMGRVVRQAAHTCRMLSLPVLEDIRLEAALNECPEARAVFVGNANSVRIADSSRSLTQWVNDHQDIEIIYINGALSQGLVEPLIRSGTRLEGISVVVPDSSRIMLDEETCCRLERRGVQLRVLENVRLAAVTVNPFSAYGHHFEGPAFLAAMESAVSVPVYDLGPPEGIL